MDLKNNVLGSLRTAWQSFTRLPVAALPPVEANETNAQNQKAQGRKGHFFLYMYLLIFGWCLFVWENVLRSEFNPVSLHPCYSSHLSCMLLPPTSCLVFLTASLTSYKFTLNFSLSGRRCCCSEGGQKC